MNASEGTCRNCGAALRGAYCHECGQRADEPRRAVIGLVQDFFVDTMAIDGKLARSIGLLLWRPGRLARRYLDGRRVYYSPPFRLYLFASVFFFLTLFWMIDAGRFGGGTDVDVDAPTASITEALIEEVEKVDPEEAEKLRDQKEAAEAGGEAAPSQEEGGGKASSDEWEDWNYTGPDWLEPHVRRLKEAGDRLSEDPRLFAAQTKEYLPRVLLLAPVFYALFLLLVYFYRRKFFVYDHFVVSLYMHAALYAYLMAALILSAIPVVGGWLAAIPLIWGWIQPFAVLRQVYGSNWVSAVLKWAATITLYFLALFFIVLFGFTYSLYQS